MPSVRPRPVSNPVSYSAFYPLSHNHTKQLTFNSLFCFSRMIDCNNYILFHHRTTHSNNNTILTILKLKSNDKINDKVKNSLYLSSSVEYLQNALNSHQHYVVLGDTTKNSKYCQRIYRDTTNDT